MGDDAAIYWPQFCGNRSIYDAFWSGSLTVDTPRPDLSNCFQDSVLTWLPCGYLLLAAAAYTPYLRRRQARGRPPPLSWLCILKLLAGALLQLVCLTDAVYSIYTATAAPNADSPLSFPVQYTAAIIRTVAMFVATVVTYFAFRKRIVTSGVLWIFWFFTLICGIVTFRSRIIQYSDGTAGSHGLFRLTIFYLYFGLVLVQFVLVLIADVGALRLRPTTPPAELSESSPLLRSESDDATTGMDLSDNPCPKLTAPFQSHLFFFWFFPTVISGWRRPVEMSDIWDIREEDSAAAIVPRFEQEWQRELTKLGDTKQDQYQAYIELNKMTSSERRGKRLPSLFSALFRTFGLYYCSGSLLLLGYDLVAFINPQILQAIIAFVEAGSMVPEGDEGPYAWKGWFLVIAMFIASFTTVIFIHQFFNITYTTGMRVRTAMTSLIYRKALRLSPAAKRNATTGEIVNLMSVDTQKLQDAPNFLNYTWSAPVMVVLAMYFLWQILGPACLTGLLFMLIVLPINSIFLAHKIRGLQKKQMKLKDARIKLMNQVLSGVKVLKLYAWEPYFRQKILDIRNEELKNLRVGAILGAMTYIIWFCAPFLVALLCFMTYVLTDPENHILDAQTAFVSMSLINLLSFPLTILPVSIMMLVQAIVSVKRIHKFLLAQEIDTSNVQYDPLKNGAIFIEKGTFSWGEEDRMTLKKIDLRVQRGRLVAVVGTVGAGKSSLISAMLGEMVRHEGTVTVNGGIAYVPQQAWIQNMSLRDNILFARSYHRQEYDKVVAACALGPDLDILPGGDQTEIGERGINLSGGQKQRVSLARAVYHDADIYLLDDPLSAVDAHVGKHIFDKVIGPNGMLKQKTRVLVTNSLTFLPQVDDIIVLKDGCVSEQGTYDALLQHNGPFSEFVNTYISEHNGDEEEEDAEAEAVVRDVQRRLSSIAGATTSGGEESVKSIGSGSRRRLPRRRRRSTKTAASKTVPEKSITDVGEKGVMGLIAEESVEEGTVKLAVITTYIRAASSRFAVVVLLSLLLFIASQCFTNIWLSWWSSDPPPAPSTNGTSDNDSRDLLNLRLGVYGALGAAQTLSVLGLATAIALGSVHASRTLHSDLLHNILKCPMSFFDTTPLGRIVNRFSKDVDICDANIPQFTQNLMTTLAPLASTIIVICYSTPIFIVVVIPLGIAFGVLQRVYVACARQIKRIDSIKRSPIYAFFSETLNGVGSIRAYKQQSRFMQHSDNLLDDSQRVWFEVFTSNRWIGVFAEFIGDIVVLFAAIFAVMQRDTLNPGLVGLSLSFALQVSMNLIMTVRSSCELETYIVAVERIKEYCEAPTEAPWEVEARQPPADWPSEGTVEFKQYATAYREGLQLVLKGVSCYIKPAEKVGVVGRTGAGKSSLTLALFRIIEAQGGSIEIDGRDIGGMGLHDVRGRLTIIPQDPVLFSGSLRFNLDPAGAYTDADVWAALQQAHLSSFVETLPGQVMYECGEDGENLSVGQRQLVCLARALLRKTRILVLDEATAAVDLETDDLIQTTIREQFAEATIITIAHRLNTIADYDRVMVMSEGEIREFDSPDVLMADKGSLYHAMARDAGLAAS